MSKKKTILMIFVVVLLALLVFHSEKQELIQLNEAVENQELIFDKIKPEEIQQIHVIVGSNSYRLQRKFADSWILIKPEGAPVNKEKVNAIIQTLLRTRAKNIIQENEIEKDQSLYGLAPPQMVLTLDGDFGKKAYSFGKRVQASARRYLQSQNDKRFFLVDDNLFNLLNITTDELFNKSPFSIEANKITELSILRDKKDVLKFYQDKESKKWKLDYYYLVEGKEQKKSIPIDSQYFSEKLGSINKIKASHALELTAETLALYGLKIPKLSGTIVWDESNETQFLLGEGISIDSLTPESSEQVEENLVNSLAYFLKIKGSGDFIYQIPHSFFAEFYSDPNIFRERKPFANIEKEKISKIKVSKNSEIKEYDLSSNQEKFNKLFEILKNFTVIAYQEVNKGNEENIGLSKEAIIYEFYRSSTERPIVIKFGKELNTTQKDNNLAPRWVELELEDGTVIFAVVNYFTYNEFIDDDKKVF